MNYKFIGKFFVLLMSALSVACLIVQFLLGHIFGIDIFKDVGIYGFLAIVFICAFISLLIAIFISDKKQSNNSEKWKEVIKIASAFSRLLWVTGRNDLRIKVGEAVVKLASCSSSHSYEHAQALIDDIGWTNHVIGNTDEAKKNIEHGIKIASKFEHIGLVHIGYRHLSGICIDNDDVVKAKNYLDLNQSKDIINKSDKKLEQYIILAGNLFNEAMILDKEQKFKKALELYRKSFKIYEDNNDYARMVKLYYFIGNNLKNQTRYSEAEDSFRKGLEEARKESRKDYILKCSEGLDSLK